MHSAHARPARENTSAALQVDEAATEAFLKSRRQDQQRALAFINEDEAFQDLRIIQAPLLDLEVIGVPALQYFGGQVWRDEGEGEGNGTGAPS
jgi:Anion-transporting ATPase